MSAAVSTIKKVNESRHSLDSPDWISPPRIVEPARRTMGEIDLDPFSDREAQRVVKARRYFSRRDNALVQRWKGRVFVNAPGGETAEAWIYLLSQRDVTQWIWVGYSLEQLQTLQQVSAITPLDFPFCVPDKRIGFLMNRRRKRERREQLIAKGLKSGASKEARSLARRLQNGGDPPNSPSHANFIAYCGPRVRTFEREFSKLGKIVIK